MGDSTCKFLRGGQRVAQPRWHKSGDRSKVCMAQHRAISRAQQDRVLDPNNLSIQLDTLIKAASAVGRTVEIRLERDTKRTRVISAKKMPRSPYGKCAASY
jgi:hypothetical protein